MQTSTPATPPPEERRRRPRAGNHLWSRRLLILAVGALLLDRLRSDPPSPRPAFTVEVTLQGANGRFDAVTTNLSDRSQRPTCAVSAFDIYGRTVGTKVFELDGLSAGESTGWDGRLNVTGRVERMTIECG